MSAVAKEAAPPSAVQELNAEVEEFERLALAAESARNTARSAQTRLLAQRASESEIAAARRKLEEAERALAAAVGELTVGRDALEIAKVDERQQKAGDFARGLEQLLGELVSEAAKVERASTALGEALLRLSALSDKLDLTLISGGLTPDPWLFRAKWLRTVELGLWLASDRKLAEGPPLDTPEQLRRSGAASIVNLAKAYKAVIERQARQRSNSAGEL